MTLNLKNLLNPKIKMSKMGEFQELKAIQGLEMYNLEDNKRSLRRLLNQVYRILVDKEHEKNIQQK